MPSKRVLVCLIWVASAAWAQDVTPPPSSSGTVTWDLSCEASPWPELSDVAIPEQESLPYTVRWGMIKAGRGRIAVIGRETMDRRPAYHVRMEIASAGLAASIQKFTEKTDTWVDQASLLPVRYTKENREGSYAQDENVILDQPCRRFYRHEIRLDKGTSKTLQGRLPPDTVDILGYLFHLRGLPLKEGGHYDLTLLSGDHLWPVTIHVIRRTKISTPAGWFDCFFIEPTLREKKANTKLRQIQVWVTADERRWPVRLRMELNVGHITAELAKK